MTDAQVVGILEDLPIEFKHIEWHPGYMGCATVVAYEAYVSLVIHSEGRLLLDFPPATSFKENRYDEACDAAETLQRHVDARRKLCGLG